MNQITGSELHFDVIVAGAGPAGSSAAYYLASAGINTALFEKEHLPRAKFCAGGIPQSAFFVVPVEEMAETSIVLDKYHFASRGEKQKTGIIKDKIYSVERNTFDHALVKKAQQAGANLFEGCRIRNIIKADNIIKIECLNGRIFTCRFLIGADGGHSTTARLSGLMPSDNKSMGFCAYYEFLPDARTREIFQTTAYLDFNYIHGSFAGIIPKKDYFWVGIYTGKKVKPEKIRKALDSFIKTADLGGEPGKYRGCPIPLYRKNRPVSAGNILLAGEAAGLVNPLSGEGIKPALDSGRIAAECLNSHIKEGTPLSVYSERIRKEIGENLETAGKFATIAYLFPGIAYDGMIHVADDALKIMNGNLTYKDFEVRLRRKILRTIGIKVK
ncbi:MAG: NAD(P)/FAD-dependent oxidoreductase [Firmicutes bacterium]|nr:NAD(P)/FAD-dependent oxidoreductase [Bacillota bacterium]